MMKRLIIGLLVLLAIASVASAELLTTADTLRQGKWLLQGNVARELNWNNNNNYATEAFGATFGYGLLDQLDVLLSVGRRDAHGVPGATIYGTSGALTLKYKLFESPTAPLCFSLLADYRGLAVYSQYGAFPVTNSTMNYLGGGACLSGTKKLPISPYLAFMFRKYGVDGNETGTQCDTTLGISSPFSPQGNFLVEYTQQVIAVRGLNGYGSPQIAGAVSYTL